MRAFEQCYKMKDGPLHELRTNCPTWLKTAESDEESRTSKEDTCSLRNVMVFSKKAHQNRSISDDDLQFQDGPHQFGNSIIAVSTWKWVAVTVIVLTIQR